MAKVTQSTGQSPNTLGICRFVPISPAAEYLSAQVEVKLFLVVSHYQLLCLALEGFIPVDVDANVTSRDLTHKYIHGSVGGVALKLATNPPTLPASSTRSSIPSFFNNPAFWLHPAKVDHLWTQGQDNGHVESDFNPTASQFNRQHQQPYGL